MDLKSLFEPKSIAVIGASRDPAKIGHVILKNLVEGGYSGQVYPVNPSAEIILYQHSFASIKDIPSPVDCAIIVTPVPAVLKVLQDCADKGVKAVIIITSGFAEVGNAQGEEEIKRIAKESGMAVVGPNCVSKDTYVLIQHDGQVSNKQIGEVVDSLLIKYSDNVINVNGTFMLSLDGKEDVYTASSDGSRVTFKRVSKVFKRTSSDNYKVSLNGGRDIICSGDHPFIIAGRTSKIPCRELDGDESIPCVGLIEGGIRETSVNLLQRLASRLSAENTEVNCANGLRISLSNSQFCLDNKGVFRPYPRMHEEDDSLSWKSSHIKLSPNIEITDELSVLCGFFVADGNYDKNYLSIGYVDNDDERSELCRCVKMVFGNDLSKSSNDKIKFGRKIGRFVFKEIFGIPRYAENKRAPDFIFSAAQERIAAFLSGLFSGDGGIYKSDDRAYLYFYSVSKGLAHDVLYLLSMLGIRGYLVRTKRTSAVFNGKVYPARDLYTVRIENVGAIKRLHSLGFRFLFKAQQQKLESAVNMPCIPTSVIKPIFDTKIKDIKRLDSEMDLYDFEVEETHNFIANGIITSNCMGMINTTTRVDSVFNPVYKLGRPKPGEISFISQSGAVGAAVMDLAAKMGVGISLFVSYGNAAVVTETDLLEYLRDDPKTKVIAMYIEGVRDGRKFLEVAKEITKRKPIILIKAGKTQAGTKAVASHTAALAGDYQVYSAAFKQAGIIEVESLTDLFDFSKIFLQPFPTGDRVGVITNGGGVGVLTTDCISANGLKMASYSDATTQTLRQKMPVHVNVANPLDLAGDADSQLFKFAIDELMNDKNVDSLILTPLMQTVSLDAGLIDVIAKASEQMKKPIVVMTIGGDYTENNRKLIEESGVPTYISSYVATRALAKLTWYAKNHYQRDSL